MTKNIKTTDFDAFTFYSRDNSILLIGETRDMWGKETDVYTIIFFKLGVLGDGQDNQTAMTILSLPLSAEKLCP